MFCFLFPPSSARSEVVSAAQATEVEARLEQYKGLTGAVEVAPGIVVVPGFMQSQLGIKRSVTLREFYEAADITSGGGIDWSELVPLVASKRLLDAKMEIEQAAAMFLVNSDRKPRKGRLDQPLKGSELLSTAMMAEMLGTIGEEPLDEEELKQLMQMAGLKVNQ